MKQMIEKIYEIVSKSDEKSISLHEKNIIVEERFGERKNIIKNYHINSIIIEDNELLVKYYLVEDEYFSHISFIKDLSKLFIAQMLSELL